MRKTACVSFLKNQRFKSVKPIGTLHRIISFSSVKDEKTITITL